MEALKISNVVAMLAITMLPRAFYFLPDARANCKEQMNSFVHSDSKPCVDPRN